MQRILNKKSVVWDYIMVIIGTGLLATAIKCLYDPMGLVTGGFTGLCIVIKEVTEGIVDGGIPLWLGNLILNIPLFLVAWKVKGKRFIWRTIIGTFLLSAWIYVIPAVDLTQQDYFLVAVFGGCIGGAGMGLILLGRATTGGTEMVAVLLQHFVRHYSVVQIMQVLDAMIVLFGLYMFGIKAGLYAIVAIFVTTKVSDGLMEGFKYSKSAFIITDHYEAVADRVLQELDRGLTGLYAKGMYSGTDKCMLYCVVSKKQIVELKDIVSEIDPDAFVIVSDVREVLGEGFLEYNKQ